MIDWAHRKNEVYLISDGPIYQLRMLNPPIHFIPRSFPKRIPMSFSELRFFLSVLEMPTVVLHVAAGFVALVMAPIAMWTQKAANSTGAGAKSTSGRCLSSSLQPLALVYFRPNFFLLMISPQLLRRVQRLSGALSQAAGAGYMARLAGGWHRPGRWHHICRLGIARHRWPH